MAEPMTPRNVDAQVKFWLGEISAARKREKTWREDGRRVLKIYNGKKKEQIPFNILYSNTETLLPALYNAQPRPVVQRRFKDADPLGKVTSQAGQRVLEFLVDTNSEEYDDFDSVISDAVLDGLLPGRGATRVKYDADIVGESPNRSLRYETACFESVKWDRWTHGFARKWHEVPWVAFEHDIDLAEAEKLFGKAVAAKMVFAEEGRKDDKDEEDTRSDDEQTDEDRKVCKVWEIWHKRKKQVLYVSPNYDAGYLKVEDDPLGLTGFYPMPKPLRFLRKANDLDVTPIYNLYENQAKELNRLTIRINRIAEALKVRGAYDGQLGDELDQVLKADDNTLVAAQNVAALENGGLEKAIWLMPLDKLIAVLTELYQARNNCKQVIYEITGIADILRGSTVASETATAQQIKAQWGSLRLKRMQREVARYARDVLRITLEVAKRFNEDTFAKMTGLPFARAPEVQAAQGQIAAARSQIVMQGQQPTPQLLQTAVPEAFATLQKPAWAQVLQLLRDNTLRGFRIDIETNSTVDVEATEDQKLMGEVLTAVSQFIQGVAPLVTNGSMPFQVAQSMLLAIVRRYRFGSEIEDYIKQMQPPQDPNAAKAQADQQKAAFELKKAQDEHGMKMQAEQSKVAGQKELMAAKMQVEREKLDLEREKLRLEREMLVLEHQAHVAKLQADVAAAHAMPKDRGKPAGGRKEGVNAGA